MGLSYPDAERLGLAREHPDHPSRRGEGPIKNGARMTPGKRSKYGAVRTTYRGVSYASKAEAAHAAALDLLVGAGAVRFWVGQPKFRLGCPENVYVADFLVVAATGGVYVVDVKGHETPKFRRDVKLWRAYGPCPLHVIRGKALDVVHPDGVTQR